MTKSHDNVFMFLTKPKNAWLNADAGDVNRKYEYWIDQYFNVVSLYMPWYWLIISRNKLFLDIEISTLANLIKFNEVHNAWSQLESN